MPDQTPSSRPVRQPPTPPSLAPVGSRSAGVVKGLMHGLVPVADGVRLHYTRAGVGDPVLLLPGWPQSWYAWRYMVPLLVAAGRTVVAVDPRGFGDSDVPVGGYDLETAARDVQALIEALGLLGESGVDIVSHDVGSWIAHAHAAAFPDSVRSLVLSDAYIPGVSPPPPAGYPTAELNARQWHFYFNRIEGLPEALIHGREREFLAWFFGPVKLARTWTIDDAAFEEYLRVFSRPGAVTAGLNYYRRVFSSEGLAAAARRSHRPLTMPILTLGGSYADADNLFRTMRQFTDNVKNRVFDGIGHHLPEECPQEMSDEILSFWKDNEQL
jgi:pimeloyl-ACP methyl ester carboxylesterase